MTEVPQLPSPALRQLWDVAKRHHVHIAWSFSGEDYRIGGSDPGCSDRLFKAYGPPLVANQTTGKQGVRVVGGDCGLRSAAHCAVCGVMRGDTQVSC